MTNGRSTQGVWEDSTKELSLKWALMVGMDSKGEWTGVNIPGRLTTQAKKQRRGLSCSMGDTVSRSACPGNIYI